MSTITSINSSDSISSSRSVINTNFSNLNTDKIETSVIDTDTTLAANSDSKIPSQKAVKAYVDAGGNTNASETARGIVEEATDAEVTAGTATGGTGAKLFVSPAKLSTRLGSYQTTVVYKDGVTTYDVSTASGTQTIAHGLGVSPKFVRLSAVVANNTALSTSIGSYNGTTNACVWVYFSSNASSLSGNSGTAGIYIERGSGGATNAVGVITFDATNITITWTKTGSPTGTAHITWEAIA